MEGTVLTRAGAEWASRPDDQRYLTIEELLDAVVRRKDESWTVETPSKELRAVVDDEGALALAVDDRTFGGERVMRPTHWSFGQVSRLASAPAVYLRKLPPQLAAINLQWGFEHNPERENGIVLGHTNGATRMRAVTSMTYGRIWDRQVVESVIRANPDGRWQVPYATYQDRDPKRATTLYASDRDVFIFLVDPENPVEIDGDLMYRGFYTWNSEVGAKSFGLTTFLYRVVCDNRLIWGASDIKELRIRHTSGAPERFEYEGARLLARYAEESAGRVEEQVRRAKTFELPRAERVDNGWEKWLKERGFAASVAKNAVASAREEEGEARSLWDIINGVTATARRIRHTDSRVALEEKAGNLMRYVES